MGDDKITPLLARTIIGECLSGIDALEAEIKRVKTLLGSVCLEDDLHQFKGNGCHLCGWHPMTADAEDPVCEICGGTITLNQDCTKYPDGTWAHYVCKPYNTNPSLDTP
jgi:hypothetical protein